MSKTFKLIKGATTTPLKQLNEGQELKNPDKFVFQGVFTACSTPEHKIVNRNGRIYMETEVLRHLAYLRDMIKEQGSILGELDHPEGRYDVQLKEASHKITDLWYDNNTKCVMGRLEVLDTENGKKLKEIINAGYPLYVSSRAAGDVNEKTKEVEIAQIFTYDVVCTPGFKEAKLERVNESLSVATAKYLNESISASKEKEIKEVLINESAINSKVIALFEDTEVKDVEKPLNDEEEKEKYLPTLELNPLKEKEDDSEEEKDSEEKDSEEKEEGLTDEEKEENRKAILDVIGLDDNGEPVGSSAEDEEESTSTKSREDIINIEAVEDEDSEEDEEAEESEEADDNETDKEETNEKVGDTKEVKKESEKKSKIRKETDDSIAELESVLNSVTKAEEVKESIIRRYPFAISLSESNFAKFASLRPKQKKRCADFIEEHEIFDIYAINELWMTPLQEEKKIQQNWLRLASQSDIDLYVAAPVEVQNAIEESAKYVILETQEQVDEFWNRTGLRQAAAQHWLNEQKISAYNKSVNENRNFQKNNPLGYSQDWISMTEEWFKNN